MEVKDIHSTIIALNLPSKGANSKRSKVEKLAYAAYDMGLAEARTEAKEKAKHNGWTNYETWLVNLWMTNEQGPSEMYDELAKEMWTRTESNLDYHGQTHEQSFLIRLSDAIKEQHEEGVPSAQGETHGGTRPGVYDDLLNAALGSVNWYEIAEHYLRSKQKKSTSPL